MASVSAVGFIDSPPSQPLLQATPPSVDANSARLCTDIDIKSPLISGQHPAVEEVCRPRSRVRSARQDRQDVGVMRTYSTSGTSDSGSALAASIDTLSLSSEDFTSTDDSHSPHSVRPTSARDPQGHGGGRRSSANATPRPPSDDEYEHILVPKSHERTSTQSSDSSITNSSVSHVTSRSGVLVGRSADWGVAGDKGKGKGADAVKEEEGVVEDLRTKKARKQREKRARRAAERFKEKSAASSISGASSSSVGVNVKTEHLDEAALRNREERRARKARKQREKRAKIAELKRLERNSAPSTSGALTSSSVGVAVKTEPGEKAISRPKRRAGVKSTLRKDRAAVRNELLSGEEGDLSSAESDRQRVKIEPVSPAGPGPRAQDEEDEDEVEGMSDLGAETVQEDDDSDSDDSDDTGYTASIPVIKGRRVYDNRSVMSSEDASSSIDVFLSGDRDFLRDKANKLRLWQALCIELGVVPGGEDLPDLPTASHPIKDEKPDVYEDQHEMPQTLTQASKLLHEEVHINIADYLQARADTASANNDSKPDYSALMKPDVESLIRYTRKKKKYIKLDDVKAEWLQPLLKDFGIKRARARGA